MARHFTQAAAYIAPEEARVDYAPKAQESASTLVSIFGERGAAAGHGQPVDDRPHDEALFCAIMVSCRHGVSTKGPPPPSAPSHPTPRREPTDPTSRPLEHPTSPSHQEYRQRNYAALGATATSHAATTGDNKTNQQCTETTNQAPPVGHTGLPRH